MARPLGEKEEKLGKDGTNAFFGAVFRAPAGGPPQEILTQVMRNPALTSPTENVRRACTLVARIASPTTLVGAGEEMKPRTWMVKVPTTPMDVSSTMYKEEVGVEMFHVTDSGTADLRVCPRQLLMYRIRAGRVLRKSAALTSAWS